MKIRLDENISPRVAKAILALAGNRKGFEVSHIRQLHGPGTGDRDWMHAFAEDGGTAIISGDNNIVRNWPDLIAYRESGLIGFFPPTKFNGLSGYSKAALLIRWWPVIIEKIKLSSRGETWRMPMQWTPNVNGFQLLKDRRFGEDGKIIAITEANVHRRRRRTLP